MKEKSNTAMTPSDEGRRVEEIPLSSKSGTYLAADRSLDAYDPEEDPIAPISVRTSVMQLIWVCGDCGEHYPRLQACPLRCDACGAPQQHFYAPIED